MASFGIVEVKGVTENENFTKRGTQTSFYTNFGGTLSFLLSFHFPELFNIFPSSAAATYIFTAPTCTTTIIALEPCALYAKFEHFILRFNKISLRLQIPLKEGIGGEREGEDKIIIIPKLHLYSSSFMKSFSIAYPLTPNI